MESLLLVVHFLGLFLGGAAGIGLPVIGAVAGAATAEHRATVARAVRPLKMAGHVGLALLIVTGIWMAARENVWDSASAWFWIKLVAVAALVVGVVLSGRAGARAMAGDAEAAGQARMFGMLNIALIVVIVLAAVFAFH